MTHEIVAHLRGLANGSIEPLIRYWGICHELEAFKIKEYGCTRAMQHWPEYSNERGFPVPHPELNAVAAFLDMHDLWADDEYGNARRRLCTWLADELENNPKLFDEAAP